MSSEMVDQIASALLYEGYLLYPYRPSALKNQQRWNFGVLYPPAWAASQTGADRSYFQMECLASCSAAARIDLSLRFLQIVPPGATERRVAVDSLAVVDSCANPYCQSFSFDASIQGEIEVSSAQVQPHTFRLTARVRNITAHRPLDRDDALLHSLASAHAVLQIRGGDFISQIDPPEELREAVAACQNTGVWPVLVGEAGGRHTMLASPIILYDYPQVAPESKGDLFDSTEIDEILILRILTLTDAEKEELRRSDERARQMLERLEATPPEHLLELHGKIRNMRPAYASGELKKGDRVLLHPGKRADIFDTLLAGKVAIIEAVEQDFEGNLHFAVVIEDDPGRDFGEMRQIGHRFFFSREEVEPLESVDTEKQP